MQKRMADKASLAILFLCIFPLKKRSKIRHKREKEVFFEIALQSN